MFQVLFIKHELREGSFDKYNNLKEPMHEMERLRT